MFGRKKDVPVAKFMRTYQFLINYILIFTHHCLACIISVASIYVNQVR